MPSDSQLDDPMYGLKYRVWGLSENIYKMHQGLKEKADEAFQRYERQSQAQARQQKATWWLTAVIAGATIIYTVITAASVCATFQANAIQREALEWQKHHQ